MRHAARRIKMHLLAHRRAVDGDINCGAADRAENNARSAVITEFAIGIERVGEHGCRRYNAPASEMPREVETYHARSYELHLFNERLIAEEAVPCDIDAAEDNAEEAEYFQRLAGLLAVEQDFYVDDKHCKADARDCDPDGIEPLVTHHTADIGMGDAVNGTFLYRCVVDEHYLAHERYHPHRIGGDNGNPHCGIRLKARLFFHF